MVRHYPSIMGILSWAIPKMRETIPARLNKLLASGQLLNEQIKESANREDVRALVERYFTRKKGIVEEILQFMALMQSAGQTGLTVTDINKSITGIVMGLQALAKTLEGIWKIKITDVNAPHAAGEIKKLQEKLTELMAAIKEKEQFIQSYPMDKMGEIVTILETYSVNEGSLLTAALLPRKH